MKAPIHLIGTVPASLRMRLPRFPLNDRFWERAPQHVYDFLKYPRHVESIPEEDVDDESMESHEALMFILTDASHWDTEDSGAAPDYNVSLRVLNAQAHVAGSLWFGVLPGLRESEVWKYSKPLPAEEGVLAGAYAELAHKYVTPDQVEFIPGNIVMVFPPVVGFNETVTLLDGIAVRVKDKTITLLDKVPFVACRLTEDAHYDSPMEALDIVVNQAYLDLVRSDEKQALELYHDAIGDAFHYQKQSSDQSAYRWDDFLRDHPGDIGMLVKGPDVDKHCADFADTVGGLTRLIIAAVEPKMYPDMLDPQKYRLIARRITLAGKMMWLDARVNNIEDGETKTISVRPSACADGKVKHSVVVDTDSDEAWLRREASTASTDGCPDEAARYLRIADRLASLEAAL